MSNQKAVHIIKSERSWKETWSNSNGPAIVERKKIIFLCGKSWDTVKFPEDYLDTNSSAEPRDLPVCKKCLKKKAEG